MPKVSSIEGALVNVSFDVAVAEVGNPVVASSFGHFLVVAGQALT